MENKELNLTIKNFEGPLDLLLSLVKDHQMDLYKINLSELATAYLKLINKLKLKNIDLASEYLVMATTLILLKARLLLNDPKDQDQVDNQKKNILQRLVEYQRFKKISLFLRKRELIRKDIFIKPVSDYGPFAREIDETQLDGHSDAIKLIMALRKMFERNNARVLRETVIETFQLTSSERREEIIKMFKKEKHLSFQDVFAVPTMNHFVLTFITILDMCRKQELFLQQENQYGAIQITKGAWIYD